MTVSTALLIASSLISLASFLVHAFALRPTLLVVTFPSHGVLPLAAPQTMTADGTLTATVALLDKKGRPIAPPTPPVWTSSDVTIATVSADGTGANGTIEGEAPGASTITVACAGLTDTTPLTVTPAVPASLAVTFVGSPP